MPTSPSPRSEQLGTPNPPAIRFTRGTSFGASRFTHLLRPAKLLAPLYGSDRYARPSGAFTSRLPTDRLPSPLLDMTTTATGLLCWRDFHPLEWQLASLHQTRTCGLPAYGLYGAFLVKGASRHFLSCCCFILLFDPRREHSSIPTAHCRRRRAQRRSRTALLSAAEGLSLTDASTAAGCP